MSWMTHAPCLQSGALKVLQVTDDNGEVLDTLINMVDTPNLSHMFGGTWDHKLLGHCTENPSFGPKGHQKRSTGARMKGS